MHVTLQTTSGCNLNCNYCYSPPIGKNDMPTEVAFKTIDFIAANFPVNTGLIFFGGEPLLRKDLIHEAIDYSNWIKERSGFYMHYKTTTNGILLDEDFLKFAKTNHIEIAISIDGVKEAHDRFRRFKNGEKTFDMLQPKIDLLLNYQPYAKALMTITPETLPFYAKSFEYLIAKGFKYIIVSLDYSANWTDADMKILKKEYISISKIYEALIKKEQKFYFSPFEMKLASHIKEDNMECYQCHLGKKQISISYIGDIYPCVQFVKDGISNLSYKIGDVFSGIDYELQEKLYQKSKQQNQLCKECDYNKRCNNKCSCLNWQLTGKIDEISPKICECERVLFPVVDSLGKKLFQESRSMFVQKHYNSIYPILSMLEDL